MLGCKDSVPATARSNSVKCDALFNILHLDKKAFFLISQGLTAQASNIVDIYLFLINVDL